MSASNVTGIITVNFAAFASEPAPPFTQKNIITHAAAIHASTGKDMPLITPSLRAESTVLKKYSEISVRERAPALADSGIMPNAMAIIQPASPAYITAVNTELIHEAQPAAAPNLPRRSPCERCARLAMHFGAPPLSLRPSAISALSNGKPKTARAAKYIKRNVPPP